jgi:hypothetical protein
MRRFCLVLPAIALAALAASGCLRSTTTIDLRPDGSGTILQETAMTAQALAMLKSFASQSDTGKAPQAEIFGEEQAKKAADSMGVTFVSGEPIKSAEFEGYRARYSFADISKIKVNMDQSVSGPQTSASAKQPPFAFGFDKGPASSTLTIQMPDQTPTGQLPGLPKKGGTDAEKAQAAQALGMMKMMMKGLFVDVSMNVDGRVIKTNAPHVEGSRVTLLQIDFDTLLANEAALEKLQSATDLKSLAGVPGLKISSEPKVIVEFAR